MKRILGTTLFVAALFLLAVMPVVGQNLTMAPGDKNWYIGPTIIRVDDSGASDIGVIRLDFQNDDGVNSAFIYEIVVSTVGSDTLGTSSADIEGVNFYLTDKTNNLFQVGGTTPGLVTTTFTENGTDLTITVTDPATAEVTPGQIDRTLFISIDYASTVTTGSGASQETVQYLINSIKSNSANDLTGAMQDWNPGAPSGSTNSESDINDYVVTFGAAGELPPSAQVEQGTQDVLVMSIDLGDAADEAVQKELESVTFQYGGTAIPGDIATGNVRLHLDGNSNGAYDDALTDPQVGSATVAGATVTVTTTPVDDANNTFTNGLRTYLLVVNVADLSGTDPLQVGRVVLFDIANPSTDITFRDEIADTINGSAGEYGQAGYITDTSVTLSNNSFEITAKSVEDTTPPTVVVTTPNDGDTDVSRSVVIQVAFSEDMATIDASDVTISGSLSGSIDLGTDGTFSFNTTSNQSFTFTKDEPYEPVETVTVTVSGTVTDNSSNLNAMGADYQFSFETGDIVGQLSFTDMIVTNNQISGTGDEMQIFLETPEGSNATDAVTIAVFTANGRRVATLTTTGETYEDVIARQPIVWDGTNGRGQALGPGLYFVQVSSAGYRRALRVLIVR